MFARDLQVQERLTQQVADWLQEHLDPRGVGVVIEAEHLCMSLRGVRAAGARTITSALHGAPARRRPIPRGVLLPGPDGGLACPIRAERAEADMDTFVLVGGGLAGAKAAETLRDGGLRRAASSSSAEEPEQPYERPPLSKGYLLGSAEREKACVHEPGWYAEHDVDLRTGDAGRRRSTPAGHRVDLDSGEALAYDKLLLATGSVAAAAVRARRRPRRRPLPAHAAPTPTGCSPTARGGGRRVVIVGAGWIGLEVAAAARTLRRRR